MDFYTHQEQARQRTVRLVMLFSLAVLLLLGLLNGVIAMLFYGSLSVSVRAETSYWHVFFDEQILWIGAGGIVTVGCAMLYKWWELRTGGRAVAEALGARLLLPNSEDFYERRLLNIVEEMALAAGMPVPPVYVMSDDSINAFAAGYDPSDAVIGVTRGCMTLLTRDQLQGVVAHEFSHILNGDMRLNIRLISVLHGILFIGLTGRFIFEVGGRSRNRKNGHPMILVLALSLIVLGYLGVLFGQMIRAGVSRQREFLADASAVQFTRNPEGISGALKVIGHGVGSRISSPARTENAHLFFGQAMNFSDFFATHPPLEERIRRIDRHWKGDFLEPQSKAEAYSEAEHAASMLMMAAPVATLVVQNDPSLQAWQALCDCAREPYQAQALMMALLLSPEDKDVSQQQLQRILAKKGQEFYQRALNLRVPLARVERERRLELVEIAVPALKQMSREQFREFRALLIELAQADGTIDLYEWCLYRLLLQYLRPHFEGVKPQASLYRKGSEIEADLELALSVLAHHGQPTGDAEKAFQHACDVAGFTSLTLQPLPSSWQSMNHALKHLALAYPHLKGRIVKSWLACVRYDGVIQGVERDLVRTMAAILEVPVSIE